MDVINDYFLFKIKGVVQTADASYPIAKTERRNLQ
jgi:hypothetical protein